MDHYQDALGVDGSDAGERDCRPRWQLIEPYVPVTGVLLDVGSNLGYYGLQAIRSRPSLAVVSVEADAGIADRQEALLREHGTTRICLVQGGLGAAATAEWVQTCDWFQMTLLLSVLHWMDDPAAVLRDLSAISEVVIAEVPDATDTGACGQDLLRQWTDPLAWFAKATGRDVRLLGRIPRHTSEVPSHLVMVSGPTTRRPRFPYWGFTFDRPGPPRDYDMTFDGTRPTLTIGGTPVEYRPGVNLVTLMSLGKLRHPAPDYWIAEAETAIKAHPGHGDPYPHNMLWGADGMSLIDGDDLVVETPAASGMTSIRRNVTEWANSRTLSEFVYVAERPGPWRRTRGAVGRVLRSIVGDATVERLKSRLGLFGAQS